MRLTHDNITATIIIGCHFLDINPNKISYDIYRKQEGGIAWCSGDADEQYIEINQRNLGNDYVTSIAHELVHCMQYQKRWLGQRGMIITWKGDEFIGGIHQTYEEYIAQPWEKQAYAMQDSLAEQIKANSQWLREVYS